MKQAPGSGRAEATPTCPHFGRCGGCSRLDQPTEARLAWQQQRARELLAPFLGGVEPRIVLPPRPPRHDRTTMLYPAQRRGRRVALGIYRRGTHDVEEIRDCRIQHRALTAFGLRIGDALQGLELTVYDEATGDGILRAVRARIVPGSKELLVGAVATQDRFAARDALGAALRAAGSGLKDDQGRPVRLVGVVLNVNPRPGNALLGPEDRVLDGRGWQLDAVGALRLRVSFASFYQLHRHADAILFRPALELCGDLGGLDVVDGYGGVGTFALRCLAAGARRVTLIESAASSCDDARHNLAANGFGDRGEVREQPFGERPLPACDLAIVDPPRAGLMATGAGALLAAAPPRVLLVSCALESLARDLELLDGGYRVVALRLCDLFPHTEHIEALTLLERR